MTEKFMLYSERAKLAKEYEEWVNKPLEDGSKIKDCPLSVITFMMLQGFIPPKKGLVVLSKKEYERLKRIELEKDRLYEIKLDLENQLIQSGLTEYIGADEIEKQARKETAKEFASKVKECKEIKELVELGYIVSYVDLCEDIDELAKQYGVEE